MHPKRRQMSRRSKTQVGSFLGGYAIALLFAYWLSLGIKSRSFLSNAIFFLILQVAAMLFVTYARKQSRRLLWVIWGSYAFALLVAYWFSPGIWSWSFLHDAVFLLVLALINALLLKDPPVGE